MNPCKCGGAVAAAYTNDQCRVCWLYHHDPAYRPFLDALGSGVKAANATPPCTHLGRSPTEAERVELKLSPVKDWHLCGEGHGFVCPCGACKSCPDYEPEG